MKIKSKLYDAIHNIKDNRPISITSDNEQIRLKKHKKNNIVDVWLDYKINGVFREIFHVETTTDCTKGDVNDIVEDMSLEIPADLRKKKKKEDKPLEQWYDHITDSEKDYYLGKYQEIVLALWLAFYEEGYQDDEMKSTLEAYGITQDDLKMLGVDL